MPHWGRPTSPMWHWGHAAEREAPHAQRYAALRRSVWYFCSARTGHRLQRGLDLQHFFLTLPDFISLRTWACGDPLSIVFLPKGIASVHRSALAGWADEVH